MTTAPLTITFTAFALASALSACHAPTAPDEPPNRDSRISYGRRELERRTRRQIEPRCWYKVP